MKEYVSYRLFNKIAVDRRSFSTLEDAKEYFVEKVRELPTFRKEKNKIEKFKLHDSYGYTLDFIYTNNAKSERLKSKRLDSAFMYWNGNQGGKIMKSMKNGIALRNSKKDEIAMIIKHAFDRKCKKENAEGYKETLEEKKNKYTDWNSPEAKQCRRQIDESDAEIAAYDDEMRALFELTMDIARDL